MSSLPGFEAMKSSPNGQMVRVHAADGSVIVSPGPSFGKWLSYNQIPQVMVDAMVSTEDKRYRSEEHTSELQSLMRISYAVFCLKKTKKKQHKHTNTASR